jgi:hypothetical protein
MRKSRYEVKKENRGAHAKVGGGGGDYCWLVTKGSVSLKMLSLYRVVAKTTHIPAYSETGGIRVVTPAIPEAFVLCTMVASVHGTDVVLKYLNSKPTS